MLSRIGNAIQAAADIVAPPCSLIDDFSFHWRHVANACQDCPLVDNHRPTAEGSGITRHLAAMLQVLVTEQASREPNSNPLRLSPCHEYVVSSHLMETLAEAAARDAPVGVRQEAFLFLAGVLNCVAPQYLHQGSIRRALQLLITCIRDTLASPYEGQESMFVTAICDKICSDHSLALLWVIRTAKMVPPESISVDDGTLSCNSLLTYPLIDAILNLCQSADAHVSGEAHHSLAMLTRVSGTGEAIAKGTGVSAYLAGRLCQAGRDVPVETEPSLVEDVKVGEVEADKSSIDSDYDIGDFPGRREVEVLLRWFVFCDHVLSVCDTVVALSITETLHELFLVQFLTPMLISANEDLAALFTSITSKMIDVATAPILVNALVTWLCEDSCDADSSIDSLRTHLLHRCAHPPAFLQAQTLRLLQTVLGKPGGPGLAILVLGYVGGRGYLELGGTEQQRECWSDEEDERYKHLKGDVTGCCSSRIPLSRTMAPTSIAKVVSRFLHLVPDDLRSTDEDNFESYLTDAQQQYQDTCRRCAVYNWPREAVNPDCCSEVCSETSSVESPAEADGVGFWEGPLLGLLLDLLNALPIQDYPINLQVTSLISSLALLPHPYLHEFLLNPLLGPQKEGVRTPYSVLKGVIERLQNQLGGQERLREHLQFTRERLLGVSGPSHAGEVLSSQESSPDVIKLESLVVLEEFSKELAAIAYAKYKAQMDD